jgi:hypothetical protein
MRDSAGSIATSVVKTYSRPGNMPHSAGEILGPKAYTSTGRVALVGVSSGVLSVAAGILQDLRSCEKQRLPLVRRRSRSGHGSLAANLLSPQLSASIYLTATMISARVPIRRRASTPPTRVRRSLRPVASLRGDHQTGGGPSWASSATAERQPRPRRSQPTRRQAGVKRKLDTAGPYRRRGGIA